MKKAFIAVLFAIACASTLVLVSCASDTASQTNQSKDQSMQSSSYETITADEAKKMIDEGSATVVDVRAQAEYDEAHLPGALCIPLDTIGSEKIAALPDGDEPLLVYCRTGVRSKLAAEKLAALGYTHVYDLGGIRDWPFETEHSR